MFININIIKYCTREYSRNIGNCHQKNYTLRKDKGSKALPTPC